MQFFTEENQKKWHDNNIVRMASGDQYASVRFFVAKLNGWLIDVGKRYPEAIKSAYGEYHAMLLISNKLNDLLRNHFIVTSRDDIEDFILTAETSARELLSTNFNIIWKCFSVAVQKYPERGIIRDFAICFERWRYRLANPQCHPLLSGTYPNYFNKEWEGVLRVLTTCEFAAAEPIAVFWALIDGFMLKQQERYGLPMKSGWWTDTDEGKFRPLSLEEIIEEKKKSHWIDASTGAGVMPGTFEKCMSELFCKEVTESDVGRIVNVKFKDNQRCCDIYMNTTRCVWEFKTGMMIESRMFELLSHTLNALEALIGITGVAAARDERREISKRGTQRNTQKAGEVAQWAVSLAQIILDLDPSATIGQIADALETPKGRECLAAQLTDPGLQAKFRQDPPRRIKARSIRDKLKFALDRGLLVVRTAPSARLHFTKM